MNNIKNLTQILFISTFMFGEVAYYSLYISAQAGGSF